MTCSLHLPPGDRQAGGPSPSAGRRLPRPGRAFSLIEMVAVLAVIAILAAAVLPVLIRQTDQMVSDQETAALQKFAGALQNSILRNRSIPSETGWISVVAAETGLDTNDVAINPRHQARVFLIDNSGWFTNVAGGAAYAQSSSGTIRPKNPRLMIVSSLGQALPGGLVSGRPANSDFSNTWNSASGTVPATGVWAGWPGNPQDILIERINLASAFTHLALNNLDPTNGYYGIDNFVMTNLASKTNADAYFLVGTVFKPYLADTNRLEAMQVLQQDSSWIYQYGIWRNAAAPAAGLGSGSGGGGSTLFDGMQAVVQQFYTNVPNYGVYPSDLLNNFTNYMGLYLKWQPAFTNLAVQSQMNALYNNVLKDQINNLFKAPHSP